MADFNILGAEFKNLKGFQLPDTENIVHTFEDRGSSEMKFSLAESLSLTTSISFYDLPGDPLMFFIYYDEISMALPSGTPYKTVAITYDGESLIGQIATNTSNAQASYSTNFSKSYSNGTLTIAASSSTFSGPYIMLYAYGGSASNIHTKDVQVGSGATSITFNDLDGEPLHWSLMFKSNFGTSSGYQRVMAIGHNDSDAGGNLQTVGACLDSSVHISISYWTHTYNDGTLTITSQGTNSGGYFHQPGYYQLTYATSTGDDSGGGGGSARLESKSVSYTPSETAQSETVTPSSGYDGLSDVDVSVGAISSSYVGSGITRRSSTDLTASGATVTAPAGYYQSQATKTVSAGSATAPSTISGTSATVSTGTNTLTLSKTISVTPTVTAGYISSGTSGNSNVSLQASVTTQGAQTIYPSTSNQTINSGRYLTGNQTINAVSQTNLSADNIKSGVTVTISNGQSNLWSVLGTYTGSGSGGPTLLNTTSIGTVNTTSTQAASLNVNCVVSGVNDYDLLIVEASVNSLTASRHAATVSLIFLTGSTAIGTKNGQAIATAKLNIKVGNSTSTLTSNTNTTAYGVYANSCSISSGTATIAMYRRYNSTSTGTMNGNYTARVYGVKLADLIGG